MTIKFIMGGYLLFIRFIHVAHVNESIPGQVSQPEFDP